MLHRYLVPDLWAPQGKPVGVVFHERAIAPAAFRVMVEEATELVVRRHKTAATLARRMRREGLRGGLPRRFATLAPYVLEALCRQHGFRQQPLVALRTRRVPAPVGESGQAAVS